MSSTKEAAQESPEQRLDAARQATATAQRTLDGIEVRLQKAIEEQRFDDAHALKQELPAAELAYAHAAADQRAIETVIDDLARRRAQREAAEAAERRKQAAVGNLNRAAARETELMDQLRTKHAELIAGVGAVKDTITAAYAIESAVRQARADMHQARIDMGEPNLAGMHIPAPNLVSSLVERSQPLVSIMRGSALPS